MASFRKRNDKWEYGVRYKEMGKYKETSKGGFKTKKEAQLAAAKVEAQVDKGVKESVSLRTYTVYEKTLDSISYLHLAA